MDLIRELEENKAETLKLFELTGADLEKDYGPGKWSVRYILHHLADSESVLFYRIRRVISEPRQVIWVYDQEAWSRALDYASMPLELSRRIFESSRDGIIYQAGRHYAASDQTSFVHSETGLRTLKDEFDKVVSHNRGHLAQIRKALGSA
jgi:hypothetical protein